MSRLFVSNPIFKKLFGQEDGIAASGDMIQDFNDNQNRLPTTTTSSSSLLPFEREDEKMKHNPLFENTEELVIEDTVADSLEVLMRTGSAPDSTADAEEAAAVAPEIINPKTTSLLINPTSSPLLLSDNTSEKINGTYLMSVSSSSPASSLITPTPYSKVSEEGSSSMPHWSSWLDRNIFGTEISPVAVSVSAASQQIQGELVQEIIDSNFQVTQPQEGVNETTKPLLSITNMVDSSTTFDEGSSFTEDSQRHCNESEPLDRSGREEDNDEQQQPGTRRNQRIFSHYYDGDEVQVPSETSSITQDGCENLEVQHDNVIEPKGPPNPVVSSFSFNSHGCELSSHKEAYLKSSHHINSDELSNSLISTMEVAPSRVRGRVQAQVFDEQEFDKILEETIPTNKFEPVSLPLHLPSQICPSMKILASSTPFGGTWRTQRVYATCYSDDELDQESNIKESITNKENLEQFPVTSFRPASRRVQPFDVLQNENVGKVAFDNLCPQTAFLKQDISTSNNFSLRSWIKQTLFGKPIRVGNEHDEESQGTMVDMEGAEDEVLEDPTPQHESHTLSESQMVQGEHLSPYQGTLNQQIKLDLSQETAKHSSKRKQAWSEQESRALREGLHVYGHKKLKWSLIKADSRYGPVLKNRSNVALKDRARCKAEQSYMAQVSNQIVLNQAQMIHKEESETVEEAKSSNEHFLLLTPHDDENEAGDDDENAEIVNIPAPKVDPKKVPPYIIDLTGRLVERDGVKGIVSSYWYPYWVVTFEDNDVGDYDQQEVYDMTIKLDTQEDEYYGGDDVNSGSGDGDDNVLGTDVAGFGVGCSEPSINGECTEFAESNPIRSDESNNGVFKSTYKNRVQKAATQKVIKIIEGSSTKRKLDESREVEWTEVELQALRIGVSKYDHRLNSWNLIKADKKLSKKLSRRSASSLRAQANFICD